MKVKLFRASLGYLAIKINTVFIAKGGYGGGKFLRGRKCTVDAIYYTPNSRSGYMLRVVDVWKKPVWLDSGWFE